MDLVWELSSCRSVKTTLYSSFQTVSLRRIQYGGHHSGSVYRIPMSLSVWICRGIELEPDDGRVWVVILWHEIPRAFSCPLYSHLSRRLVSAILQTLPFVLTRRFSLLPILYPCLAPPPMPRSHLHEILHFKQSKSLYYITPESNPNQFFLILILVSAFVAHDSFIKLSYFFPPNPQKDSSIPNFRLSFASAMMNPC